MDQQQVLQMENCSEQPPLYSTTFDAARHLPAGEPLVMVIETDNFRIEIEIGR